MSFVSILATKDYINVVCDGQVTGLNGQVLDTKYKKFKKVSKKQFIAYAGDKGLCEDIANSLKYINEPYPIYGVSKKLEEIIKRYPFEVKKLLFAIGGVNEQGNIEFCTFSNKQGQKLLNFKPIEDKISFSFLFNSIEGLPDDEIDSKFINLMGETGYNTSNKGIKAQKKLNNFIAEQDSSVNKITFILPVKK